MRTGLRRFRLIELLLGCALHGMMAPTVLAEIPCGYEVTAVVKGPFCGLFGFPPISARDISEDGRIVGYFNECILGPSVPFVWSEATGLVKLDLPDGFTSGAARGIDDQTGWIVGSVDDPDTDGPFAAVWQDGEPVVLGTLPEGNFSDAWAVSAGVVVGRWGNDVTGNPGQQAFLWENDTFIDLSPDLGTPSARAQDVNAAGQVTGWMGTSVSSDARAFVWRDGTVSELPPIPGGFTSEGWAINQFGNVTGGGRWTDPQTEQVLTRAFFWNDDNRIVNLGTLPGFLRSAGLALNSLDTIVGDVWGGVGNVGFVWSDDVMRDLNDLVPAESGVVVTIAHGINDAGQIAAQGADSNEDPVALLLTPIDAPPGDLTCDGEVGEDDFWMLLDNWGICPPAQDCPADLDGDGQVGTVDFLMLLANWS